MAMLSVSTRSQKVRALSGRFELDGLTDPEARQIAMECARTAALMLIRIREDSPELVAGLTSLADARDQFISAKTTVSARS